MRKNVKINADISVPRFSILVIAVGMIFMFLPGCSTKKLAVWQVADLMKGGFPAYMKETDPMIVRDAMPANLKLIDAMLENDPNNTDLLFLACQGYAAYAFMFLEDESPKRAKAFYVRAKNFGFALLANQHLLPDNLFDLQAWDKILGKASKSDVPAIFWTAFAWGGQIQLDRESPLALADLPLVLRLVQQALALDASYWFAGPDTFLGFYHGSLPKMLGGKPDTAREHFEAALNITHRNFLMTQVLYAKSYAVQTQDRKLFKSLLDEVINHTADEIPEAALSNAIAREKAYLLIARSDELFQ